MSKQRRDYYEVLGVSQTATDEEITKAYRKLALKLHPDKQINSNAEEAQKQFQELLAAYGVLKDPNERKWYDQHRDLILNDLNRENETIINLYEYFNCDCFDDFDDSENGFYSVFEDLFCRISTEECSTRNLPHFGNSKTKNSEVKIFYQQWKNFTCELEFWDKMKHELSEAPNRTIRRMWEKENKKIKDKLRKERTENVKQLINFVQRMDPRWQCVKDELMKEKEEREKERERKENEEKRKREEMRRKQEMMMGEEYEISKEELNELEKISRYYTNGNVYDDERNDLDDEEEIEWNCVVCEKSFKTENQLKSHENSKKHKQAVKILRKQMEQYD